MIRKMRKPFAVFAQKQREKIHLQVVDASTSNIQCSQSMPRTMTTKLHVQLGLGLGLELADTIITV